MTFYYRLTVTEAFASVQYTMAEINLVGRSSMYFMCISQKGLKNRDELTWVKGVVLAVLTTSFGVTGYCLPWDQIGYWEVKIIIGVSKVILVIGSPLVELLHGSANVGESTLTRFYSLHTFIFLFLLPYLC
ncbi:Cytochrome b6 [Bienertia sinuspersici]